MLDWLKAHAWKLLLPALVVGAVVGAMARRPQPAVDLKQTTEAESKGASEVQTHQEAGPVDVKRRWTLYGPQGGPRLPTPPGGLTGFPETPVGAAAAVPCPVTAVLEEEEHRGAVATDTHATASHEDHTVQRLDLRIRPAPAWSLQVGIEDILGVREPRLALRYRLGGLGPCANIWAEGSVRPRIDKPLESQLGAALACDVQ